MNIWGSHFLTHPTKVSSGAYGGRDVEDLSNTIIVLIFLAAVSDVHSDNEVDDCPS